MTEHETPPDPKMAAHAVRDDFLRAAESADPFTVAVRCHQFVDLLLGEAISESLSEPHALEVRELSFLLKVDLAIAFAILPGDLRPLFAALNRFRNLFAHEPKAALTSQDALNLFNTIPSRAREHFDHAKRNDPHYVISESFVFCFAILEQTIQNIRDRKVESQALHEIVREVVRPDTLELEYVKDKQREREERIRRKVLDERRKRNEQGLL